jgi:hypothetical protein
VSIAAAVFTALALSKQFITREVTEMGTHQLTKSANRSLLGSMNATGEKHNSRTAARTFWHGAGGHRSA